MGRVPYRNTSAGKARPVPKSQDRLEGNRFYASQPWRSVRSLKLDANPLCERCESKGLTVVAKHVHHVIARRDDPSRALDLSNLEALCIPCHTLEELERRK